MGSLKVVNGDAEINANAPASATGILRLWKVGKQCCAFFQLRHEDLRTFYLSLEEKQVRVCRKLQLETNAWAELGNWS